MTENKSKEDLTLHLMAELLQELARLEIKQAIKEGKLTIDVGMDDLFFKGVCFGIAIASEKLSLVQTERKKQEQVKKN